MSCVYEQSKVAEEDIHSAFGEMISALIGMLRDREAALIGDVETVKSDKEKELRVQKEELEFLVSGIRHAVLFSEAMVKVGSGPEIMSSHQQVVARMTTLAKERESALLEPVIGAQIDFVGRVEALRFLLKDLGAVVSEDISVGQSSVETPARNDDHLINEVYSFKVILVDKKGNNLLTTKAPNKAVELLAFRVTGLSKVKVLTFPLSLIEFHDE